MKEIEISDIWIATYIFTSLQVEPKLKPNPKSGLVTFVFPYSENVLRALTDFQRDKMVPVYTYSVNFKILKNKIIRLKKSFEDKRIEFDE
jgi:hypothetical protein